MSGRPILVMAGGTGGHVYPALAVAKALQQQSRQVVWLGTHRGLESRVVIANNIDMEWISVGGLLGNLCNHRRGASSGAATHASGNKKHVGTLDDLLYAVLIPGVGYAVNGSTRWLRVGVINIQVSEPARLCLILYIAGYLVRQNKSLREQFAGFLRPMLVLSLACGLLLAEPDFGAAIACRCT